MSNVRITATGDEALSVEIMLGDQNRAWRDIEAGESADMAIGGNQTLVIGPARDVPSTFITPDNEPAVETPWVTGKEEEGADIPVGVDVTAEDDGRETPAEAPVAAAEEEAEPLEDAKDYEAQSIGAGEVGDIGALFGGAEASEAEPEKEAESEASVVSTLEADSPLEVGSLSDLPSPFDTDAESAESDAEEAEDKGSEAQA